MMPINNQDGVSHRLILYLNAINIPCRVGLEYLAEGAANVIFSVRSSNINASQGDESFVLRMRKDLPFTIPIDTAIEQYESRISPLFASNPYFLLEPVKLKLSQETVETLNEELHKLENDGLRPINRQGVYLPSFEQEPYGILLPNLYHGPGEVIEFKPKWLVQSPSAPSDARNCRTCALNAMRRQKSSVRGRGDSGLCPFELLSSSDEILMSALMILWDDAETLILFTIAFKEKVQPVLRQLQRIQRRNNEVGLEDFTSSENKDFSVAMALRDCSIFLKVTKSSSPLAVDITLVKILDLDLKDAGGGKLAKWGSMEKELIDEGWYTKADDPSIKCAINC